MKSDVFCLTDDNGSLLPPPIQATVLAKYSRSPLSAREVLKEVTADQADKFQEKWVIQYGHSSVAELATVPVCMENVSVIASKFLESFPRAGYSEKSTRYQKFTKDSFVTPAGAPGTMKNFASKFYDAYERMMDPMIQICAEKMGMDPNDPEVLNNRVVKARAFDNLRYLLPGGTGTNLAAVINMRDARDMVKGLRGHSNPEFQELGEKVHSALLSIAPTLVKHAEAEEMDIPVIRSINKSSPGETWSGVSLIDFFDGDAEAYIKDRVLNIHGMSWEQFSDHMDNRGDFSAAPRIFRALDMTFEITMDYGAYRDLQRHRRCEQWAEPLSCHLGYVVPDDISGSPLEAEYRETMELIHEYNDTQVTSNSDLMQYMIPIGYLHRSTFKMDLAELYYIVELRTKPQGHISYRRIAYEMYEIVEEKCPGLMKWCRAIKPDSIGNHN